MIHSLLVNRKHIIEVGMTLGSDEQDLVKALEGVADAAASVGGVPTADDSAATSVGGVSTSDNTIGPNPMSSNVFDIPAPTNSGAVDSPFPPLFPSTQTGDSSSPSDPFPTLIPTPNTEVAAPGNGMDSVNDPSTSNQLGIVAPVPTDSSDTISSQVVDEANPIPEPIVSPEPVGTSQDAAEPSEAVNAKPEIVDSSEAVSASSQPNSETKQKDDGPLAAIKKDVLVELRPLVDKLNVSPEDKFDTLLLLIRSTDDSTLIEPAHEAAKAISDETRRAEALLEIVKEIDYLTRQK